MELKTDIFQKEEIKVNIHQVKDEIISLCSQVTEDQFKTQYIGGKWSIAENLEHLIISTKAIIKALGTNKLVLRAFGTSDGTSRSSNELLEAYKKVLKKGLKAPAKYGPKVEKYSNREEMYTVWKSVMERVVERMEKWSTKDLDKYRINHPAIGKITLRELLLFTVFHTRHHYNAMERLLQETKK